MSEFSCGSSEWALPLPVLIFCYFFVYFVLRSIYWFGFGGFVVLKTGGFPKRFAPAEPSPGRRREPRQRCHRRGLEAGGDT